jgi:chemotaxis protein histidine kinase CheA
MKTQTTTLLVLLFLTGFALAACEDAALISSDPNVSGVQAHATLEFVNAVQTSTAQAHYAAQWRTTVQAAATQDSLKAAYMAAQSTSESIRAAAAATQTEQVWNATATAASNQATSTAAANATAQSWSSTATQAVWNRQATSDAASLQAMQTAQAAQAEMAQLAAERQRTINTVQATAPWVILAIAVPLAAYLAWIWGRTEALRRRAIPRDLRGDAPILILDDHGRRNVIDPDLFFGAVISIPKTGQPEAPVLITPDLQSQVKARDQAVDLLNRGLAGQVQKRRALPTLTSAHQNPLLANVRVVDPAEIKEWLPDVMPKIHRHALGESEVSDD